MSSSSLTGSALENSNTWKSSHYIGGGIHGTFEAVLHEGTTMGTVRTTYSRGSQYRAGQTVSFTLHLTRNESFCYGISPSTFGQKLLVTIPLDGSLEGTYRSNLPIDRGIMRFEEEWIKCIINQIPLQEDLTKPILPEPNCCEQTTFCCSVMCTIV